MMPINHGRINMLPKTLILALVISQRSTFLKINSRMLIMNLLMNLLSRDLYRSTIVTTEMVAKHHQLFRKRHNFKNQSQNQEPSKKEMFLHLSSEGIMIEEIFQSEQTIKTHFPSQYGRFQSNLLTTITTYQFSSTEQDRNMILTEHLQFWVLTTFLTKEVTKYCQ